jgi:hypothetical protein
MSVGGSTCRSRWVVRLMPKAVRLVQHIVFPTPPRTVCRLSVGTVSLSSDSLIPTAGNVPLTTEFSSALKMEAVCSSETFVSTYKSTRRCYTEGKHRHAIAVIAVPYSLLLVKTNANILFFMPSPCHIAYFITK